MPQSQRSKANQPSSSVEEECHGIIDTERGFGSSFDSPSSSVTFSQEGGKGPENDKKAVYNLGGDGEVKEENDNKNKEKRGGSDVSSTSTTNEYLKEERYQKFPLVISLLRGRDKRKNTISERGRLIDQGVKSDDRWLKTVFLHRERAIDKFYVPLFLVMFNALVWTIIVKTVYEDGEYPLSISSSDSWDSFFTMVLTTSLAFLLVFRLNRVAVRWWETRRMWGAIVAHCRNLSNSILEHTNHAPEHRDRAIGWVAAFAVATKQHLRYETSSISSDELCGFLPDSDITKLSKSKHPCLEACAHIRHSLKLALHITGDLPAGLGAGYSSELRMMEHCIHKLVEEMGGLERVRSTPLPIIFVTHLRTFLLGYLLSLPYFYGQLWGWGTIPAVALTAYALLGIDGAASECESPFQRDRLNHLDMEKFCLTALDNIEQLVIINADNLLKEDQSKEC